MDHFILGVGVRDGRLFGEVVWALIFFFLVSMEDLLTWCQGEIKKSSCARLRIKAKSISFLKKRLQRDSQPGVWDPRSLSAELCDNQYLRCICHIHKDGGRVEFLCSRPPRFYFRHLYYKRFWIYKVKGSYDFSIYPNFLSLCFFFSQIGAREAVIKPGLRNF